MLPESSADVPRVQQSKRQTHCKSDLTLNLYSGTYLSLAEHADDFMLLQKMNLIMLSAAIIWRFYLGKPSHLSKLNIQALDLLDNIAEGLFY